MWRGYLNPLLGIFFGARNLYRLVRWCERRGGTPNTGFYICESCKRAAPQYEYEKQ